MTNKLVLVKFGGGWGTQVAALWPNRKQRHNCVYVRKWRAQGRKWTGPLWVSSDQVMGTATEEHVRKYRVDLGAL